MVTVPSSLFTPVMLRQPPVAGSSAAGYRSTLYGTPMFNPFCRMYSSVQVPLISTHFCSPAVCCDCVSAMLPFTAGDTRVPSPSSQTYSVVGLANHSPNGNVVVVLAVVSGKPGKTLIGTAARAVAEPVGNVPGVPTW